MRNCLRCQVRYDTPAGLFDHGYCVPCETEVVRQAREDDIPRPLPTVPIDAPRQVMQPGWLCPRCSAINAPFVNVCGCTQYVSSGRPPTLADGSARFW